MELLQIPRQISVCWKTFVQVETKWDSDSWDIQEKDLEAALKELQEKKLPIQRGDFVSFEECPSWGMRRSEIPENDECRGFYRMDSLYIFDGKKICDLGDYPDDYGSIPEIFACFNPDDYYEPSLFFPSKDDEFRPGQPYRKLDLPELDDRSVRYGYIWMKPGEHLSQIQENLSKRDDVNYTWFISRGNKKYFIIDECEESDDEFENAIRNMKPDTLFCVDYLDTDLSPPFEPKNCLSFRSISLKKPKTPKIL